MTRLSITLEAIKKTCQQLGIPVRDDMFIDREGVEKLMKHLGKDADEFFKRHPPSAKLNDDGSLALVKPMTLDMYQEIAIGTAIYPPNWAIVYPIIKMNGEAGECAEKIGKWIRDQECDPNKLDRKGLLREFGDVLWYIANALNDLGYTLQDCAVENIEKLRERKQRKQLGGSGDNREQIAALADAAEGVLAAAYNADFSNGVGEFGIDEGRVKAGEAIDRLRDELRKLGRQV